MTWLLSSILFTTVVVANAVDPAARAQITPAPAVLPRELSLGLQTCGFYLDAAKYAGYTSVYCNAAATCASMQSNFFGCCSFGLCDHYTTCITTPNAACSTEGHCLKCTACATYYLAETPNAAKTVTSYSCGNKPSTFNVYATLTQTRNTRTSSSSSSKTLLPTKAISCIPDDFAVSHGSNCATQTQLLLPLFVSNIVFFAFNILISRYKFQSRLKFWRKDVSHPEDYVWGPLAGLGRVVMVLAQAVATAALIRAGGYGVSFGTLIALWLLRPRMIWSLLLWFAIFGVQFKAAATDGLFADLVLNVTSLPIIVIFIVQWNKYPMLCGLESSLGTVMQGGNVLRLMFGSVNQAAALAIITTVYMAFALLYIFVFVAFLWRRRLSRGWAIGALFLSMAIFVISWSFWVYFIFFTDGVFCMSNVAAIAAIHAVVPLLSGVVSSWLSNSE